MLCMVVSFSAYFIFPCSRSYAANWNATKYNNPSCYEKSIFTLCMIAGELRLAQEVTSL